MLNLSSMVQVFMAPAKNEIREFHPYKEFLPPQAKVMIIGSFPIGKFSHPDRKQEIKSHELEFFFGGEKNLLWKLLGDVYHVRFKNVQELRKFLREKGIAIGDVIRSCRRKNGGGKDTDLYDIEWNLELLGIIRKKNIKKLFFTSKKVEAWFRRLFPDVAGIEMVTLISPSAQSYRSIPARKDFQDWRQRHPDHSIYDFILEDYRQKFDTGS